MDLFGALGIPVRVVETGSFSRVAHRSNQETSPAMRQYLRVANWELLRAPIEIFHQPKDPEHNQEGDRLPRKTQKS
jgi:hypothetical protein